MWPFKNKIKKSDKDSPVLNSLDDLQLFLEDNIPLVEYTRRETSVAISRNRVSAAKSTLVWMHHQIDKVAEAIGLAASRGASYIILDSTSGFGTYPLYEITRMLLTAKGYVITDGERWSKVYHSTDSNEIEFKPYTKISWEDQ